MMRLSGITHGHEGLGRKETWLPQIISDLLRAWDESHARPDNELSGPPNQ